MPNRKESSDPAGPDPATAERAGRNQSAFREVNEQIAKLTGSPFATYRLFVCECTDTSCAESLEINEAEYRSVREDGARFVVLPGHQLPDVERVVETNERFLVVEKVGVAAEIALAGPGARS